MASNIPAARKLLQEAIKTTSENVTRAMLTRALTLMTRKKYERTPVKSEPMSAEKEAEIRALKAANPDFSNQEIANRVGVNPGRVSETLNP